MNRPTLLATAAGFLAFFSTAAQSKETRFLHDPAISSERIAFVYADDVWTAELDGSNPKRLTSHPGAESRPRFSPDGKWIAFEAAYDGNRDVYAIPVSGGEPRRLTWHPGADLVRGFTPDGDVLFLSQRDVATHRHARLFTISLNGDAPKALPLPSAYLADFSPDGKFLAYTPLPEAFRQWKHYRGGRTSRIWIVDLSDLSVKRLPQPVGRCNDTYPMSAVGVTYFLSDRDGEFNLYSYRHRSEKIERLTNHDEFPVETADLHNNKIVYERCGYLHLYDIDKGKDKRLSIDIAADTAETRARYASGVKWVRDFDVSPTGRRAVFEFRGEIVTVPEKKGDPRNLTETSGVHERSPAWSPDRRSIAYFSDAGGEYALVVRPSDGSGEAKSFSLQGSGFYHAPRWAPDSKTIAYIDSSNSIYLLELDSGTSLKIASEPIYGPSELKPSLAWSPDSRFLAYTLSNKAQFRELWLYSVESAKSDRLTDGLAHVNEPAFDAGGEYLYFLASTDAGPVAHWFDQSNADSQATMSVFMVVLDSSTPNPLLKQDDEEPAAPDPLVNEAALKERPGRKKSASASPASEAAAVRTLDAGLSARVPRTKVDSHGIEARILALPIQPGELSNLQAGRPGKLYFIRRVGRFPGRSGEEFAGTPSLFVFDLKEKTEETLSERIDGFRVSATGNKIIYHSKNTYGIVEAGKKFSPGQNGLATSAISVRVDPRQEWLQIFREAWRINRDYFYAKNMHGLNWEEMRVKYEPMVAEAATREDLNRIIRALCSELSVGHSYLNGGDRLYEPATVPVGLLGADYEIANGRYRFKRLYGGANWDPKLKSPLVGPGIDVKEGEYLLEVDGREVKADAEVYRYFENKVGRRATLKIGPHPNGRKARTIVVEPIADESGLRNRAWIEDNLRKVRERTNGRVAYVYVPNTADQGHEYFKRYFFPQAYKDAVIIDERFNGGGQLADYYISLLTRPVNGYWATRHGEPQRTPTAAFPGPKVMIVDETAGSGGDFLPWMFRKFRLGTIVGRRTWGGLVGILGFPVLMDGGTVTAPDIAFYDEKGWAVENEGVNPDIEVEQWPAEVAKGNDPQLDRAIEIALEQLKKNPPAPYPERPADPVKAKRE